MTPTLSQTHVSFVGRRAELQRLKAAFDAAASGEGALVMLVGEPGIGKTALCQQLVSFVHTHGGLPLVGHSYPDGSASLPYQPFVEAFESFARQRDTETLRQELGSSANEVARMVPALRNMLQVELAARENPEDDRLRLLSGVLDCLRNIGATHPLLLLLGTYRDVEVDRAHPLAAALAELRRVSQFERIHLGELSVDEVQRLLASSSQQAVPRPLAELVQLRSGGNALFTHELLRFLLSEGLVERREGALRRVDGASLAGQMPEGLRDVVGKRLSRLSGAANQVLSIASVIGREFSLEVVRRLATQGEDELERALEEAVVAAILDEQLVVGATITYRFSHAFFQQTLSDEIMAPRRIRLHQHIARVLENVHGRRLEEHAAELAEHYAFSSDAADLAKSVHYAELAAKRASDVFAYGEAARQLERALAVQDLVDPDDQAKRCDLLLSFGEALFPAGETERVIAEIAPDALRLADSLGDRTRAFRACRLALDCLFAQGAGSTAGQPEALRWAERAHDYAEVDSIERVRANLGLAWVRYGQDRNLEARALRLESLALARQLDDPEALFASALSLLQFSAPQRWEERVGLAVEAAEWPREGVSGHTLGLGLWYCGRVLLAKGERARAEELWRQVEELAKRMHLVDVSLFVVRGEAILAILDGHLEHALALVRQLVERADEAGAAVKGQQFGLTMLIAPVLYLGRADIYVTAFDDYARLVPTVLQAPPFVMLTVARAICLAQLGREEEARTLVDPLLDSIEHIGGGDEFLMGPLTILLEAAVVLEHREAVQALVAQLACVARMAMEDHLYTCVGRQLGDAAVLLGDRAAAQSYYTQALDAAGKIRFRPELALTHLRLAELMLEDGDDSEALKHLDLAIPELRDMKMQPGLDRGLGILEQLGAQPAAPVSEAVVSTVLTGREREVSRLLAAGRSNREIADALVITEGTVEVHVKHILSKLGLKSRAQVAAWAGNESL
jgi:DNA-binding CsgD family transcriptional regulator